VAWALALSLSAASMAQQATLTEVQQLKAEKFQLTRSSFGARLEKAQNDAKRQAEEQLKQQLQKVDREFQAELVKLQKEQTSLEAELRAALKCETEGFDFEKKSCMQDLAKSKKEKVLPEKETTK